MYVCMYVCIDILFLGGDFPKNYYNHEARVVSMFLCFLWRLFFCQSAHDESANMCTQQVGFCARLSFQCK